jgi:glutathione S-transferase
MSLPILYSFRRCPYAIRARMALAVSGLRVELREVSLAHKPASMLHASPKGTVPVMVLPDGSVLEQSLDIMAYALDLNDPEDWQALASREAMAKVTLVDTVFKAHLDGYKYPDRQGNARDHHRDAGMAILIEFDRLCAAATYLAGPHFSLIDAAIFPFVRQFAAVDAQWFASQPVLALHAWLKQISDSALFEAVMTTAPIWQEGDPLTVFPRANALWRAKALN